MLRRYTSIKPAAVHDAITPKQRKKPRACGVSVLRNGTHKREREEYDPCEGFRINAPALALGTGKLDT